MPALMWFRRDLRLQDNPALFAACKNTEDGVIGLFVITPDTWIKHAMAPIQVAFLLQQLQTLSDDLWQLNIPLLIRTAPSFVDTPALIEKLTYQLHINKVYFNRQYEWDERQRDASVINKLSKQDCVVYAFDDQVVIPPQAILNKQEKPFKIFTPFKRQWISQVEDFYHTPLARPKAQKKLPIQSDVIPKTISQFSLAEINIALPKPGEDAALRQLKLFCNKPITCYHETRDFPALHATSRLSPYLALGILSSRQCIANVMREQQLHSFDEFTNQSGPAIWVSELIWREFYKMIIYHYPDVCKYKPFQSATDKLKWKYDKDLFAKWCQGLTGFPLVDAAMRQLNQTGWMHNRLRMVTAMFLTKILFIDWRWGERYFSEHLIDADFSANNGGWQWSASTGTDAVPYFRIFNPTTQSQRFDAKGDFIRQYCPELSALDAKSIHDPFAYLTKSTIQYPKKIVDYKKMRELTIAAFKKL